MRVDEGPHVVDCAGVPVTACTPVDAAEEIVRVARNRPDSGLDIHLVNAYTIALADEDPELRGLLGRATRNYPDGKSVVWANRLRYRNLPLPLDRVYGPDLFLDVVRIGQRVKLRHYLLGSTPQVVEDLRTQLLHQFPDAIVAGVESPPFRDLSTDEREAQYARIRSSGADVVWVGLGTPKQDREVARLAADVAAIHVAVGAAFDFISGHKRQAPAWLGRAGLEWVFRLANEPRRLCGRYLWGNLRFLRAAWRHR